MLKTKIVEPILFGYFFCRHLMLPVEDQLIYKKCCLQTYNTTFCDTLQSTGDQHDITLKNYQNVVQELSAEWKVYVTIVRSIPAAFMTIIFAVWSDHVGRKPILVLPVIGELILAMSMIFNSYYIELPLYLMLIGIFISSMFGNFVLMISACFCYITDNTDLSFRTQRNIILESMIYIGAAISSLVGGIILLYFGFTFVYGLAIVLFILQLIYWFFIEDGHRCGPVLEKNKRFYQFFAWSTFSKTFEVLTKKRPGYKRAMIWLLLGCFIFPVLFVISYISILVLYLLHEPLNFLPTQIGYVFAEIMSLKFLGALIISYVFVHRLHLKDYYTIILSFLSYCGFYLSLGFSRKEWHVYTSGVWALGAGVAIAVIRGKLSKLVSPEEHGRLFFLISCVEVVVALITGVTTTSIYQYTVSTDPSLVFYVLGGMTMIPVIITIILLVLEKANERDESTDGYETSPLIMQNSSTPMHE